MPNNWKKYKLDEMLDSKNQGVNTTTEKVKYSITGIPVIRAKNISEVGLDMNDVVFVEPQTFSRIRKECKPQLNDILYTNIGSQMGNAVIVNHNLEFTIAWNVLRMVCNKNIVSNHYLKYLLNENNNKTFIRNLNTSSTMPFVSGSVMGNLEFLIPPLPEQTAIAEILSALDDKIELNLQTNKTLEDMANALYKHWFVDFGPFKNGKFVESELGLIPEGWEVKKIGGVFKTTSGGTPSRSKMEYYENGGIQWVK